MLRMWNLYCRDERGNFAIMFALIISMLMLGVAVVIETSRMQGERTAMQDMADAAALAGAYIAKTDVQGRDQIVRDSIGFHQALISDLNLASNAIVTFDDESEQVSVTIPRSYTSFFSGILGKKDISVAATSVVSYQSEAIDPVSIAFALDVSGSMSAPASGGAAKIDVLKQSTKLLFTELENASERPDLLVTSVRTGMSAYNTDIVSTENMLWGWNHLENSVDNLLAGGGTNSTPALTNAYQQLKFDRSFRISDNPNFQIDTLREYVVFMTDGDNNQLVWDDESSAMCKTMQEDGIEIYSIAFTAPEKGQLLLLDCASWNSGQASEEDFDDDDDDDDDDGGKRLSKLDKCQNSGAKGKGKAVGICKKWGEKSKYFFDAEDATTFKEAFALIGKEIAQNTIRITG